MAKFGVVFLFLVSAMPSHAGLQLSGKGLKIGNYPTGKLNNISDVVGIKVGHSTVNKGNGKNAIRTGVTILLPADDLWTRPVPAGVYTFNGVGEAAGFSIVKETGVLQTPIAMTNTLSVGDVQKALAQGILAQHPEAESPVPLVMECDDSSLNNIHGFHVGKDNVQSAIREASANFAEGSVGAGTGMISFDFKSGIGSSSRIVTAEKKKYTIGILVNANIGTGTRHVFRFMGTSVGPMIKDLLPKEKAWSERGTGSIVIAVATDAPLDSRQLERLGKRAMSGVFRLGTPGYSGSGDYVIAFSTAYRIAQTGKSSTPRLCESCLNDFFEAVADGTEEAVLASLVNNQDMKGRDDNLVYALPFQRLKLPKALLAD